jgi:hypothetical protein
MDTTTAGQLFDLDTPPMAITIRQPWASLITAGIKTIENRSWPTTYRGPLLIHAGLSTDIDGIATHGHLLKDDLPAGAIIGTVQLVTCIRDSCSPWAEPGQWHWILKDPQPCDPRPARGRLGLWRP